MRKTLSEEMEKLMEKDDRIWVLTADLGWGVFDKIRERFPERFLNLGVSEQAMIGIAAGMAYLGKIPFVYSITPFLLYRPYEFLRILIDYDKANVKLIASGRDDDYSDHNFSHTSHEDKIIVSTLHNIRSFYPQSPSEIPALLSEAVNNIGPYYINIKRK